MNNLVVVHVKLMIPRDRLSIVQVVDQQTCRFAKSFFGAVSEPVDLLQAGSISQMKSRHGIAR